MSSHLLSSGTTDVLTKIFKHEGVAGFYKGTSVCAPSNDFSCRHIEQDCPERVEFGIPISLSREIGDFDRLSDRVVQQIERS
jgi:hypothetical protein